MKLFLQSERRILGFILALVPHLADAEDLVQETCMIMWNKFDQFEKGTDFVAWGISIARYRVLNYRRSTGTRRVYFSENLMRQIDDAAVGLSVQGDERLSALQSCLGRLREKDRELIRLRYFAENSTKQTAREVGRSADSVYKSLNRIHDALLLCMRHAVKMESFPTKSLRAEG
ncbi:RNA polymerase sigma-70 factor, ECF subfamily [Neorhodopirellula lusitana]|uniref:RNA polymerase sigma-70 factor, ECF subfamily n=2 Tax=Neorhodopirellula lusitana TaxID=445327 RepID=A0ABY1PUJ1_9BACT|nr:RNA polymerase sigma-70 factor, ECF subfamily [Neorhodopirellula lusitana]